MMGSERLSDEGGFYLFSPLSRYITTYYTSLPTIHCPLLTTSYHLLPTYYPLTTIRRYLPLTTLGSLPTTPPYSPPAIRDASDTPLHWKMTPIGYERAVWAAGTRSTTRLSVLPNISKPRLAYLLHVVAHANCLTASPHPDDAEPCGPLSPDCPPKCGWRLGV
jgi:hypothetical protein